MFLRHPFLSVVTMGYLALVGWLTLSPQPGSELSNPLWTLARFFDGHRRTAWITFPVLEFVANIAMFVPIGVFLVLLFGRRKWWLAIVVGVLLSVAIEYAQTWLPMRVPDLRDIIANSAGVIVGTVLALLVTARAARRISRQLRADPVAASRPA